MADDKLVIHIDAAEFTPPEPDGCPHKNTIGGFGLAGGGYGAYTFCEDCGQVIDKVCEEDE